MTSPYRFLYVRSTALFFRDPRQISSSRNYVILHFVRVLQRMRFNTGRSVVPIFVGSLASDGYQVYLGDLYQFVKFEGRRSIPATYHRSGCFICLDLYRTIILNVNGIDVRLVLRTIRRQRNDRDERFANAPIRVIATRCIARRVDFRGLIRYQDGYRRFS